MSGNGLKDGNGQDVGDLGCYTDGTQFISTWVSLSLWDRIVFLFKNKLSVSVHGQSHPPISVTIDDILHEAKND